MPYFQHRFLNPREPRYDWLDAMPKGACVAQQPYQIPPLPTVWPENVDLWAAAWPNGLPEAGASSFDGRIPLVSSVDWTMAQGLGAAVPEWMHNEHRAAFERLAAIERNAVQLSQELRSHVTKENQFIRTLPGGQSGLGGLLPFAEVGGWFDFVKVGVILAGGLMGGYLVGYLWRELRTPRATNRRKRNRRRRRNASSPRRRNSETAKWRGYDDGFAGRAAQPPKGVWEREAYEEGYAMGRREKTAERGVARRYHEV